MTGKEPMDDDAPQAGAGAKNGVIDSFLSPQDTIVALKQTVKGSANRLAAAADCGDGELVGNLIDGNLGSKYFNRASDENAGNGVNTGFMITPAAGAKAVTGIQFATANDSPERDPVRITVEGSNDPQSPQSFTLVYQGTSGLGVDPDRNQWGRAVTFTNTNAYKTYWVLCHRHPRRSGWHTIQRGQVGNGGDEMIFRV